MSNPLDEAHQMLLTARGALKVVRRVIENRPKPLANTPFEARSADETLEEIDRAGDLLDKLFAFAMFAAFERRLRDHVAGSLDALRTAPTTPPSLAAQLHTHLEETVDDWRMDTILDLFECPGTVADVANAKGIRALRNAVAHGSAPHAPFDARIVYRQLTQYLQNAGLVP